MGHMSSSRQFAIMSLHAGLKDYHEVCTNYLSHSAISSLDCGKGSRLAQPDILPQLSNLTRAVSLWGRCALVGIGRSAVLYCRLDS